MLTPREKRELRALLVGYKKDGADVTRIDTTALSGTTISMCATATDPISTALTGQLRTTNDAAYINWIDVKGAFQSRPIIGSSANAAAPYGEAKVRLLWVWYHKPSTPPDNAGTLPPVTDCLVSDNVNAFPRNDTGGSFTILSDRIFDLGRAYQLNDSSLGSSGFGGKGVLFNYRVNVYRQQFYKSAGSTAGRYSTVSDSGTISTGLLVGYLVCQKTGGTAGTDAAQCIGTLRTRLNYTG